MLAGMLAGISVRGVEIRPLVSISLVSREGRVPCLGRRLKCELKPGQCKKVISTSKMTVRLFHPPLGWIGSRGIREAVPNHLS